MKNQNLKEIISSLTLSAIGTVGRADSLRSVLGEHLDVSSIKKIDLDVFEQLENASVSENFGDRELDLQYVLIVLENKKVISDPKDVDLSVLNQIPKELLCKKDFISKLMELVIENTDCEKSLIDQYVELPLGLRSNPLIAIYLVDFVSGAIHSLNTDQFFYGAGVEHIPSKLLKDQDFIKEVMKINPKLIFGDQLKNVASKFSSRKIKEICNDREFLDLMRHYAETQEHEGASYIFMLADPKKMKVEDVMSAVKEKAFSVLARKDLQSRFIGISSLVDELKKLGCDDFKYQPFGAAFSEAPKSRFELEDLIKKFM